MKPTITIESQHGPLGEYLLVCVVNGQGLIGICDTTNAPRIKRETFYVGTESLLNVFSPVRDNTSLRQIWQCSSIDKCPASLRKTLNDAADDFFYESVSLSKAIYPVLEMLTDGLYVVHTDKTYPTDGAGNFFWSAYLMRHELNGSAPFNPLFGQDKDFSPPFLVPTRSCSAYNEKSVHNASSRLKKGRRIGGIAYHLCGMFSALICGHINAAACLMRDEDFPCVIIEPLNGVTYFQDEETGTERVSGLACPFVKIPLEKISRNILECFLLNRRSSVPEFYAAVREHAEKVLQPKNAVKDASPVIAMQAEKLPDAEMLSSAFAVPELTDEQIQLLLSGETRQNDKVIISPNYYESIVYACNFLQYTSPERFIDFTISILNTPSLSATYHYVAERLRYTMDARVNETFINIRDSEDPVYVPIKEIAERYIRRYSDHIEQSVNRFLDDEKDLPASGTSTSTPEASKYSSIAAAAAIAASKTPGFSSLALQQELERRK